MGLSAVLRRLAADAPAHVFAIAGAGAREAVQDLRLVEGLRFVDTPRAADVLLVAGAVPSELLEPLARVHDAMAHPRRTIFWTLGASPSDLDRTLPKRITVEEGDDVAGAIRSAHRELLVGAEASEPPVLPDVDPAPWRGVGPYGQGGSAMTGGTPYGRPMAELAPDRDGLRLDALPMRIGPFFPRFPAGLTLDLKFTGDVVIDATVPANPFAADRWSAPLVRPGLKPFIQALSEPVAIAELELARARDHLRWLADALVAHQLGALGLRVLRLASQLRLGDERLVLRLERTLARTSVLDWSTAGVGWLRADALEGLGAGPVARAAGLEDDVRTDDPGYRALGFKPVVHERGDASGRWRQRLAEAAQSLDLAARAGDLQSEPVGRVESPRGRLEAGSGPTERLLPMVPELINDLEWGDAVTALVSLDLDLEEAAAARLRSAREAVA